MQPREVRRFNRAGIREVDRCLSELKSGATANPIPLLSDDDLTEVLIADGVLDLRPLRDRLDAATHLDPVIAQLDLPAHAITSDTGLWTWLAIAWFEQLWPLQDGKRRCTEKATLILAAEDYKTYFRHYLAGPWGVFNAHRNEPDRALALLLQPVNVPGELVAQFAAYKDIVTSGNVMRTVTNLYIDMGTRKAKVGSGGSGPGSPRRFVKVFSQFALTWDMHEMTEAELLNLLPAEFDRFR
jgi:hypothetical protein